MMQWFSKLPDWFRNGALIVLGAVAGWLANNYMEYRAAYKENLGANYEAFDAASAELKDSLIQFSDIARGAKVKSKEDVEKLQKRLLVALGAAEDLQRRMKADRDIIEDYKSATVDLKHASDSVTGPIDGKALVVSVSDYLEAEQRLRETTIAEQNSFLF